MSEPLSTDRFYELLSDIKQRGLNTLEAARLLADASEKGGAGPKPDDYLMIHVNSDRTVDVSVNTHYVNHGGTWQPCRADGYIQLILPDRGSQFVTVELEMLGLKIADD